MEERIEGKDKSPLNFMIHPIAQNQSFAQLGVRLKSKVLVLSTYLSKSAIPWYKPIIAYF